MLITFKFCSELEILLPNTTSQFDFQFASASLIDQRLYNNPSYSRILIGSRL